MQHEQPADADDAALRQQYASFCDTYLWSHTHTKNPATLRAVFEEIVAQRPDTVAEQLACSAPHCPAPITTVEETCCCGGLHRQNRHKLVWGRKNIDYMCVSSSSRERCVCVFLEHVVFYIK